MKDQLKAIGIMALAGIIVWAVFTACIFTHSLNKLLSGQCSMIEQQVLDASNAQAVEKALAEYKASVDNP